MPRVLLALALIVSGFNVFLQSEEPGKAATGHYLFAWTGDLAKKGNDFLTVIDADPASPSYGQLLTTLATDQQTVRVHHTEYTMPAGGMLFANDHDAGRTFIFDVRDPLHPKIASSFTDMAGFMHPHSFLRLPNGHVLATFQHSHATMNAESLGKPAASLRSTTPAKSFAPLAAPIPHFPMPCSRPTAWLSFRTSTASSPPTPPWMMTTFFAA
jgi:hypothetical protein